MSSVNDKHKVLRNGEMVMMSYREILNVCGIKTPSRILKIWTRRNGSVDYHYGNISDLKNLCDALIANGFVPSDKLKKTRNEIPPICPYYNESVRCPWLDTDMKIDKEIKCIADNQTDF